MDHILKEFVHQAKEFRLVFVDNNDVAKVLNQSNPILKLNLYFINILIMTDGFEGEKRSKEDKLESYCKCSFLFFSCQRSAHRFSSFYK